MNTKNQQIKFEAPIPQTLDQKRLDVALSILLPEYSRTRIQEWIKVGYVTVDEKEITKPKDCVYEGQTVHVNGEFTDSTYVEPQAIDINVVYEDKDIIVINKPASLVTHPGAGNADKTLLNALIYHYPELTQVPRGGIIHRLDKDTTGLMVVARNLISHKKLVAALQKRRIKREYEAIVKGVMISGATINAPIGRHSTKRTHMSVKGNGKHAITHYRIIKRFGSYTHIQVILETGRTHQIRVHMAHIGYTIVGDSTYGRITKISMKIDPVLRQELENFKRQALHAKSLQLQHPTTNELMSWQADTPNDMKELLALLEEHNPETR